MNIPFWRDIYITNSVSVEDADKVSSMIKEENTHKFHMLEKTPDKILTDANNFWAVVGKSKDKLIWFMWLMEVGDWKIQIFERWSLIVDPDFRWMGLGNFLRNTLLNINIDKPIYTITNVPKVIQDNLKIGEIMIPQVKIPQKIREIIELEWSLLDDDVMFVNQVLQDLIKKL